MSNDEKESFPSMPFDSVFKTATQKTGHLLIAVIEQMFHVKAELVDLKEFERSANERYLIDDSGQTDISKRYTDSCFKIGGKYYHVECQSTDDGSILFRLTDYNMRIALDNSKLIDSGQSIIVKLPDSGLINLRSPDNSLKFSPKKSSIVIPIRKLSCRFRS